MYQAEGLAVGRRWVGEMEIAPMQDLLELDSTIKAIRKQLDVFKHKSDSNCYWSMNYKGEGR